MQKFKINLQFFAGEKTEKATPRRKQEARKKGQVVKSNEVITVLLLTLTLLVLKFWLPHIMEDYKIFFYHIFTYTKTEFTVDIAMLLISETVLIIAKMVGPILLIALIAGYIANVLQIGFLFTTESLKMDLSRLNPLKGMKRIFSKRAIAELVKTILKTCLVGFVAFYFLYQQLPRLSVLMDFPLDLSLYTIGDITFTIGWRILAVLVLIAIVDYVYQLYEYEKSLKMSKQEIKEEFKMVEGDPHLKAELKARQRQLASRRMMQEVPEATVVITNPTHLAIAIKYEDKMAAPIVVAKGKDFIAQKIKEVAIEHNIVLVENRKLAQILYREVEIGSPIPVELYKAIAEVLAYVYKFKGRF
ncbi:MAG: flagellar biosynthesis protein FlhB [Clostridia bacterium]|jgi:flagellar biosynthetic protein FlhB|nr:flagellar biosynthesis protein FlhB [Clostridia bacterium]MDD4664985.1 flagellar biosynthesis protein FlhB [Clostridia bacterium]